MSCSITNNKKFQDNNETGNYFKERSFKVSMSLKISDNQFFNEMTRLFQAVKW